MSEAKKETPSANEPKGNPGCSAHGTISSVSTRYCNPSSPPPPRWQLDLASGGMSRTLPWPPPNYQRDCRKDKRRKSRQGHTKESSSRLAGEVLGNRFSSLTISNDVNRSAGEVLDDNFSLLTIHHNNAAEGSSGDRRTGRKRKLCQEHTGDLINKLPDEVLENMFSSLTIQEAAVTSSVSRRWGRLWKQGPALVLDDHNVLAEGNSDHTTHNQNDLDSVSLRSNKFTERVNDLLLWHQGIGARVFEVHFDLNSSHAAHLDKWVHFASESDAQDVTFNLGRNGTSESRYNFPLHHFGNGQGSLLQRLCLKNCVFRPPLHSSGFSALTFLALKRVTIADSDIQNIFSCCPVLCYLGLVKCDDLVNLRISHESLLYLAIISCKKLVSIEIHSTSLSYFEYDGHEVGIKYASTPNMRKIVTMFNKGNCVLSKDLLAMKSLKRVTLSFLSTSEEPRFIRQEKFTVLQFVSLSILPSWNNVLGLAYLLKATPNVTRLHLEAHGRKHHYQDIQVCWPERISLKKLRTILVGGFAAQTPLTQLLVCLIRMATRLRYLEVDPHHHGCKDFGKWFRKEVSDDEAARDDARNAARATMWPRAPPSVKFVVK